MNYVVSLGPKTQTVEVPDVLKSYPDTAEQVLSESGLNAVYGGQQYSDYPEGDGLPAESGSRSEGREGQYDLLLGEHGTGGYR